MGIAKTTSRAVGKSRKGIPHTLTSSRAAQIHRWQMLGAAARRGHHTANTSSRSNITTSSRSTTKIKARKGSRKGSTKGIVGTYAKTALSGTAKLIVPTALVTPIIPGWQPGDRLPGTGRLRRKRR